MKMVALLIVVLAFIVGCAVKVKILDSMIPDPDLEEEE